MSDQKPKRLFELDVFSNCVKIKRKIMSMQEENGDNGSQLFPLSRRGGPSYLETSEQTTLRAVPHSMLYRELGLTNNDGRLFGTNSSDQMSVIQRQLMKSRGQVAVPLTKQKPGGQEGKWKGLKNKSVRVKNIAAGRAVVVDLDKHKLGNTSVVTMDNYLFIRNEKASSYDCWVYNPNTHLEKIYCIPANKNWKGWAVAYLPDQPIRPNALKDARTLYILENSGKLLQSYNLDSWEAQPMELFLDEKVKFGDLEFSHPRNEVTLQCVKSSLPENLVFDCIMIDHIGFKPKVRWQMQKSAIPSSATSRSNSASAQCSVKQSDQMILLSYGSGTGVKLCDLDEALKGATITIPSSNTPNDVTGVAVTHLVTKELNVLLDVQTKNSVLVPSSVAYPPHYTTSSGGFGIFKVYDGQSNGKVNTHELISLEGHEEDKVEFHEDDSARLLITGVNSIRVVSIQRRENLNGFSNSELVEEFHVRFTNEDKPEVLNPPHLRANQQIITHGRETETVAVPENLGSRPRRATKRVVYHEEADVLICTQYSSSLDCLVIMKIMERGLRFYFYDNQSWNLISTLNGLEIATNRILNIQPGIFSFSVSSQQVTVRRNKSESDKSAQEIILIPLLHVPS